MSDEKDLNQGLDVEVEKAATTTDSADHEDQDAQLVESTSADDVSEDAGSPEASGGDKAKHAKSKPFSRMSKRAKIALGCCCGLILACVVTLGAVAATWLQDLPDYTDADSFNTIRPTEVYASDRTTLIARFQLENRVPLESLDQISNYAVLGTVATEDERFYDHNGFDLIGICRALVNNLTGGTLEGASTITQQLVRNTVLIDEMNDITYKRKVREIFLAIQLEKLYDKDDVLLLYMNTINYGGGAYGIEAAAQRYFSKPASELTLNEAATLVGIPQSPTSNCPLYYPENTKKRRDIVLDRMVSYGAITQEEADACKAEEIVLNPTEPSLDGFLMYPYFGSYVRDQLMSSYDLSKTDLFKGGLTVYTTLDLDMQALAETVVDQQEAGLNSNLSIAMTAVDPNNGFVRAMVGGKDFYANQWNLAAQAKRQPGSSFKTFTLVTALEQGISPSTPVNCSSWLEIGGYRVENYGGGEYGTRSIASAFAVSSNTGFIRICAAVGPENVVEMAHRLGIQSELDPFLSVTLGSEEVTTLEMAGAYATIANAGVRHDTVVIEQVVDRKGNVLIDHTGSEGEQVISREVAHAAIEVMKGVVNGGTGGRARLACGQPVAGKTGTSEESKDSWFVGITPQLSVAVWIGDPTNQRSVYGLNGAAVYGAFMNRWMEGREIVQFFEADDPEYTKRFSNTDLDVPGIKTSKDPNEAPDMIGSTLESVKSILKDYKYTTEEKYDDNVEAGTIISQRVENNKLVIVVSKGRDPEVVKKEKEEAAKKEQEQQQQQQPATPPTEGNGTDNEGGGTAVQPSGDTDNSETDPDTTANSVSVDGDE